ncbi:heterokaryon incompatibility protein-domain-containing protein [Xylariaceae sp. FL1272]|nr:heterokaryon incompatibility protein-domain-containing protein [Xylariaceae sp. FL1272]
MDTAPSIVDKAPYRTLDRTRSEIRLLRFIASTSKSDSKVAADIRVTLHIVSLDDADLKYYALSYTWGDITDTVTLTVDDIPFQATRSLVAALKDARTRHANDFLWVLAICIDQSDIKEKNQQVPLMGHIFTQTHQAIIWLAPCDDKTTDKEIGALFELIDSFAGYYTVPLTSGKSSPDSLECVLFICDRFKTLLSAVQEGQQKCIETFMEVLVNNKYWKRAWTLQEFILPENGYITCGVRTVLNLNSLASFVQFLAAEASDYPSLPEHEQLSSYTSEDYTTLTTLVDLARRSVPMMRCSYQSTHFQQLSVYESVALILDSMLHREATDPRDIFYGLQGIYPAPMVVDYGLRVKDVFTMAAQWMLKQDPKIRSMLLRIFLKDGYWARSNVAAGIPDSLSSMRFNGYNIVWPGVVIDSIQALSRSRIGDTNVQGVDYYRAQIDESIEFFFTCPKDGFLTDRVTKGARYVGGGSQLLALAEFWLQNRDRSGERHYLGFNEARDQLANHVDVRYFLSSAIIPQRGRERMEALMPDLDDTKERLAFSFNSMLSRS